MSNTTTTSTKLADLAERLAEMEVERDEATAEAENLTAGMKEVALFRAANAQGCIGQLARPLLREAQAHAERVAALTKATSLSIGPTPHPNATDEDLKRLWNACEYPERPPDEWVMYHVMPDCHGCNIAKQSAAGASPKGATP